MPKQQQQLNVRPDPTTLLLVPGHKRSQSSRYNHQWPSWAHLLLIRRKLVDPPPASSRTTEVYGRFPWSKGCVAISNHADAVLLVRLRVGHAPLLKAYANLLDPSTDPLCPLCKETPLAAEMPQARCDQTEHLWKSFSTPQGPYHQPWKGAGARKGHPRVGLWRWCLNNNSPLKGVRLGHTTQSNGEGFCILYKAAFGYFWHF